MNKTVCALLAAVLLALAAWYIRQMCALAAWYIRQMCALARAVDGICL